MNAARFYYVILLLMLSFALLGCAGGGGDGVVADGDTLADDYAADGADDDFVHDSVCEDPAVPRGPDDCTSSIWTLYCTNRIPLIIDGVTWRQNDAVKACQNEPDQLWTDIHDCFLDYETSLPQCLQEKGWPPEYPDVFDVNQWKPVLVGVETWQIAQALNLFYYDAVISGTFPYREWNILGAVTNPTYPMLRVGEEYRSYDPISLQSILILESGNSKKFTDTAILVPLRGFCLGLRPVDRSWFFIPWAWPLVFKRVE